MSQLDTLRPHKSTDSGRIWLSDAGQSWLESCGLESVTDVLAFEGGQVVNRGRHRCVRQLKVGDHVWFLKQVFRGTKGHLLRDVMKLRRRKSSSRVEYENMVAVGNAGVRTPDVIAVGEILGKTTEQGSFIVMAKTPGHDLLDILAQRPGVPLRSPAFDRQLFTALLDLVDRLHRSGLYFQDFLAKHVFVDVEGQDQLRLSLIDLARVQTKRGEDRDLLVDMLSRLNASLPFHALGSAVRGRFAKALEKRLGFALLQPVAERTATHLIKRRNRYVLSPRPRPAEPHLIFSADGRQVFDEAFRAEFESAGVEPLTNFDALPQALFRVFETDQEVVKRLVNAHHLLWGWVSTSRLCSWRLGGDGPKSSIAVWKKPTDRSFLVAFNQATESDRENMIEQLEAVGVALITAELLPKSGLTDWLFWDGREIHLELVPPFISEAVNADRVLGLLKDEIGAFLGQNSAQEIVNRLSLKRKGLLGHSKS